MNQLAFDISLQPSFAEDDFLVSTCNEEAWQALTLWDKKQEPCALIKGPKSSGKTHLSYIWKRWHNAEYLEAWTLQQETDPQQLFHGRTHLIIENCEQVADESSLFHLLNFMRNNPQKRLLLTVHDEACWNGFALPDLRSRLQALPQATLHEPDDHLLQNLLLKYFHDRQISISESSLNYLLPRIERHFEQAKQTVEAIDRHAFEKKCAINRKLIQEVLTNLKEFEMSE